jgi:uncharacterized protein (DUF302 family)
MKTLPSILIGFVVGVAVTGILGWKMAPGLMLKETQSPYNAEKTVEIIQENARSREWVIPSVTPFHKSVKKTTGHDIPPVYLVNICKGDYAYEILKDDSNKIVSVFMPCTISVYEKSDGKAYIGSMNAGLLGKMFGGTVAEIMGNKVAEDQKVFISIK